MIENINDYVRQRIANLYMLSKFRQQEIYNDYLLRIKVKDENLYQFMMMIIAGDAYEFLKWMELHKDPNEIARNLINNLEEIQNVDMTLALMENNLEIFLQLFACFIEKNKNSTPRLVDIFNYTMYDHYAQIQRINYYFNYEMVYSLLKGYFIKPVFNKKDFINLYNFYEELDDNYFIEKEYIASLKAISLYNNKLYQRVILEMVEDFYVYTKWLCSNKEYSDLQLFDLKLLDYLESHELDETIKFILGNHQCIKTITEDFIFYNTAKSQVTKEMVIEDIHEPASIRVLNNIKNSKNKMN